MATTTQETTNVPWSVAQPYIQYGMQAARNAANAQQGFGYPNFATYVPMSSQTTQALGNIWKTASAGDPLAAQSQGAVGGILSGNIANQYGNLQNQYGSLYDQASNPYFAQAVQNQSDQLANDVQRQFSGLGRYGSAADTGALTQQLGQFRTQALSNQWNQNVQNQLGILSGRTGALGQQQQGQLAAVAAAPGAYQQSFLPAEYQSQVGSAYEDLAQRQLQSNINRFNAGQQQGWNILGAYNQAIGATGGNAPGFNTQSVIKPSNPFGAILGGALGGASLGGQYGGLYGAGVGALGGGVLGGLSSLFSGL